MYIITFCLALMLGQGKSVLNPDLPGKVALTFREDLRFGGNTRDENYLWSSGQSPISLEVDRDGNFYVCDTQTVRLLVYDSKGRFIRQMARRGQGPGEYEHLSGFRIFNDGSAVGYQFVSATSRFNYYNQDMTFGSMQQRQDPWNIADLVFSKDGEYAFAFLYNPRDGTTSSMASRHVLLDHQLRVLKEFSNLQLPRVNESRFYDPEYWVEQIAGQFHRRFRGRATAAFCSNGDLLLANTAKYEITRMKDHEHVLWKMEKKYRPIPIKEQEIQAFGQELHYLFHRSFPNLKQVITSNVIKRGIEAADHPAAKNPIYDIIPMESGSFLVVHDYQTDTRIAEADVFSKKGHFIGTAQLPKNLLWDFNTFRFFFKNGFAFAIEESAIGENQIIRYRYELTEH